MTLDWFTLAAQVINFVVLLVLLRAFLYKPILQVMREREEGIEAIRAEAEAAREAARGEIEALRSERANLDRTRRERLAEIELEGETLRETRRAAVEREAQALRTALADALQRDREQAFALLRRRNAELVLEELDAALRTLADASLEERAAAVFRQRVQALDPDTRERLRDATRSAPPLVATAFEPSDEARAELRTAVQELLGADAEPRFVRDERLTFGVSLTVGGMRVDGSAAGRLEALGEAFEAARRDLARVGAGAAEAAAADASAAAPQTTAPTRAAPVSIHSGTPPERGEEPS